MPFHEDELAAAEEVHLRSLTAAEAEGDERAVEAVLGGGVRTDHVPLSRGGALRA